MNKAEVVSTKLLTVVLKLRVAPITANSEERRADLRAFDDDGVEYLFEVKTKTTDQDFHQLLLEKGEAYREDESGYTNVISRKIREAVNQLESTPSDWETFRLIVFASFQEDAEVDIKQFIGTLYGIENLVIVGEQGPESALNCFYFTYSDFMRYPLLDGAIILWGDPDAPMTQMCANPFGHRVEVFKDTYLYRKYHQLGAVLEPTEKESKGLALIADGKIDPRDRAGMIQHIREKYNLAMDPVVIPLKLLKGGKLFKIE